MECDRHARGTDAPAAGGPRPGDAGEAPGLVGPPPEGPASSTPADGRPPAALPDGLSPAARELYVRVTRGDRTRPVDEPALRELRSWRLVTADPARPGAPVPHDPGAAVRRRVDEGLSELASRAAALAALSEVADALAPHFERAAWRSGSGSEFLAEPGQAAARIAEAAGRADTELLTACPPEPGRPGHPWAVRGGSLDAAARGLPVRVLYRDGDREHPAAHAHAAALTARGGQVRTLAAPFQSCVVVDRRQAFIPDLVGSSPAHAAWHVADRALVAFIAEGFEDAWRRSDIWDAPCRRPAEDALTRRQREILADTAAGVDQRITARRLGIGLRTLTKELSALRARWGVPTLAALAYQWALSADRRPDADGPSTAPAARPD
ncbi:hypothetical protein C6N75_20680 [Streptomyces solincola]|uniref:HTH luxR-type domain-containing protein n=1 Tax=Streptomyces solincola TaxID=2100817 RepID=A0A2S9PSI3_9ACTN|nr:hypothetical protein C6N75_20680 [Streptomyces solincola]